MIPPGDHHASLQGVQNTLPEADDGSESKPHLLLAVAAPPLAARPALGPQPGPSTLSVSSRVSGARTPHGPSAGPARAAGAQLPTGGPRTLVTFSEPPGVLCKACRRLGVCVGHLGGILSHAAPKCAACLRGMPGCRSVNTAACGPSVTSPRSAAGYRSRDYKLPADGRRVPALLRLPSRAGCSTASSQQLFRARS